MKVANERRFRELNERYEEDEKSLSTEELAWLFGMYAKKQAIVEEKMVDMARLLRLNEDKRIFILPEPATEADEEYFAEMVDLARLKDENRLVILPESAQSFHPMLDGFSFWLGAMHTAATMGNPLFNNFRRK